MLHFTSGYGASNYMTYITMPIRHAWIAISCIPLLIACEKTVEIQQEYPRPVKVMQIDLAQGVTTRILKGEVQASERAILSFRVPGEINRIHVRAGQSVKKGELLASLDPATYQQDLAVAEANYELRSALLARSTQLVAEHFVSKNDHDETKSAYVSAKSSLATQQNRLDYTQLRAPYDGVISSRYAREHQFVAEKQEIFDFQGETNVDVLFQLPEQYIGAFQRNQNKTMGTANVKLAVKFSGRDGWSSATLKELSTIADSATGSYSVVATLSKPEKFNALPGMAAEVKLEVPIQTDQQTKLPSGAVLVEDGQQYLFVWLSEQNRVKKVAVEVENNILKKGVNDGDWIVSAGAHELIDGQSAVQWIKERGL